MKNYFVFNGKSTLDFGVTISGGGTYSSSSRDVEYVSVAGRNGDLIIDNGRWSNDTVYYDCFIVDKFKANLRALRDWLNTDSNYHRLEDTYHLTEYRLASFSSSIEPSVFQNSSGSFTINFSCKPQRFIKDGDKPLNLVSGENSIYSQYIQEALPLLYIASGTGSVIVNDNEIQLTTNPNGLYIDCDIFEVYDAITGLSLSDTINLSTNNYFTLKSGKNSVILADGMSGTITPRWFVK